MSGAVAGRAGGVSLFAVAAWLTLAAAAGCRPGARAGHPVDPGKPIDRVLLEPMVIEAHKTADGFALTNYDAESLFDAGLTLLGDDKPAGALPLFEKLLDEFPGTSLLSAALFNAAFCHEKLSIAAPPGAREEHLEKAVALYGKLAAELPGSPDATDARFREGYCLEALGRADDALAHYQAMLGAKGLATQDTIELKARIGTILVGKGAFAEAEAVLRETVFFYTKISDEEERIDNTFYAAQAQFEIGEIWRARFEAVSFSAQEAKIRAEFDEKLAHLLKAKDAYVETIKIGNYHWAAAAGYRVGALLKRLHDDIVASPVPPMANTDEMKDLYVLLVKKKVKPLLTSAVSVWEKTLLMTERVGYDGEWVEKTEQAMEEAAKLLGAADAKDGEGEGE